MLSLQSLTLFALLASGLASPARDFSVVGGESAAASQVTLFTNATFYLGDEQGTRASALLVADGRVLEFGSQHSFAKRRLESQWEVIDLHGAHVVPGLQDSNGDVLALGEQLSQVDLTGIVGSEAIIAAIEAGSQSVASGEWIFAHSWEPRELPKRGSGFGLELSAAFPTNPVRILHTYREVAFLNERALIAAGLSDERVLLENRSEIEQAESGVATGLVFGNALKFVEAVLPNRTLESIERNLLAAQNELLSMGLTAVHDMRVTRDSEEAYRSLLEQDALKLRIVGYLDGRNGMRVDWLARGIVKPDDEDRFCIQGVAFDADGSLAICAASLLGDYRDCEARKAKWMPSVSQLRERIASAMAAGLQPAVRVTGDRACRDVLDVYEEFGIANPDSKELRPRLEGVLVVAPKDWARFPVLAALPSMQPTEATTDWIETRLREDRVRGAIAWRDVVPNVGQIALGSRFPVRTPDPLVGLQAARRLAKHRGEGDANSQARNELVSARAALAGYTVGAAHAAHQEDRRGQLFVGFWADMTVFDKNPIEGDTEDLLEANVLMTVVNGEIVWSRDQ